MSCELNFDGLVGPTHNYAGLSFGNTASAHNAGRVSNPRAAALQGLAKMRKLVRLGVAQAVLPPQERPFLPTLRKIGYTGSDASIVHRAWLDNPKLLANFSSASAMWAANAATVSPSADCSDRCVHITPANLGAMPHRSIEPTTTARALSRAFNDERFFVVHDPLPTSPIFGDEGAANHNRLCAEHGASGIEIFIDGRTALDADQMKSSFPGRQTNEANRAIALRHKLFPEYCVFARQNIKAIDMGAFHNDVVCVANERVMMFYEMAFEDLARLSDDIKRAAELLEFEPILIQASEREFPLKDVIASYFFNSQLVTLQNGTMALILPTGAAELRTARDFAERCLADETPISELHYMDVRQSMANGGGPACLRLRVVLNDTEAARLHQPLIMDDAQLDELEQWVTRHYRDRLAPEDLSDPALLQETQSALDEVTQILNLGTFYHFQCHDETAWQLSR